MIHPPVSLSLLQNSGEKIVDGVIYPDFYELTGGMGGYVYPMFHWGTDIKMLIAGIACIHSFLEQQSCQIVNLKKLELSMEK